MVLNRILPKMLPSGLDGCAPKTYQHPGEDRCHRPRRAYHDELHYNLTRLITEHIGCRSCGA